LGRQRPWARGRAAALTAALVVASVVSAATATSGLERIRTRYYRLNTDLPPAEARDVARFLDGMFVSYARIFRLGQYRKAPLKVFIFRTRKGFLTYGESKGLGEVASQLRGFFSPDLKAIVSYGTGKELCRVLAHEGTHQFITLVTEPTHQPPVWFHEGLASYFETASWEKGKLKLGAVNRQYLAGLALMRPEGRFVPVIRLRRLLTTPQPSFTPLHYAEAWSFVYFLLDADDGRNADVLNRYFILIQQREDPVEAFARAFRAPLDKVERAWCTYVNELLKQNPVPRTGQPSGGGPGATNSHRLRAASPS